MNLPEMFSIAPLEIASFTCPLLAVLLRVSWRHPANQLVQWRHPSVPQCERSQLELSLTFPPSPHWGLTSLSQLAGGGVYVTRYGVANFEGCNIHDNTASARAYKCPYSLAIRIKRIQSRSSPQVGLSQYWRCANKQPFPRITHETLAGVQNWK